MPTFRVATWNVENLFRPKPGDPASDHQAFQDKLNLLAGVITAIAPDVIALQEIGGEEPLHDLQQALGGAFPHRAISAFPDPRGIRVAFLSQLAIEQQTDIVDFPQGPALTIRDLNADGSTRPVIRMGRGALRIRVTKAGRTTHILTTHLKSKLLTYPTTGQNPRFNPRDEDERAQIAGIALLKRTAEAVTLRMWANSLLEGNVGEALIVLGDLNDVPEAQTSLIFPGPSGSEIGTGGFDRPDKGDDARLFNVAPLIPEARRYSRIHFGRKELLDQILASEEWFPVGPGNKRALPVADSVVDFEASLPSVTDNPNERASEVAPDHAPVVANFTL